MKCLVIQTAYLGDIVLTMPLLRRLRELPDLDALAVLTTPVGAEFLRGQAVADRLLIYDKRGRDRGPRGFLRTVRAARRCGFGLAVIPHRSARSGLMALMALVPERIGFDESGGRVFLTTRVPYRSRPHEIERFVALADAVKEASREGPLDFHLDVPPQGVRELESVLTSRGVEADERLVVAAPGSRWATKRWRPERFGQASARLSSEFGMRPIVAGASDEAEVGAAAAAAAGGSAVDLTGDLSLSAWVALMARASIVLSNDSASAHVAAGVGTPVVAVFGPTVPSQGFAPYSKRARVVETPLDCRPCGRHGSDNCRVGTNACMDTVGVDDVLAAARSALETEDEE